MSVLLVCGFGRCGSSLLMQMLYCGGVKVEGHPACQWSYFEDPRQTQNLPLDAEWLLEYDGGAVKVLEPHTYLPGAKLPLPAKAIWLDRDQVEQAKSWVKYAREVTSKRKGFAERGARAVRELLGSETRLPTRKDIPSVVEKLKKMRADGRAAVREHVEEMLTISYEDIIKSRHAVADEIAGFWPVPHPERLIAPVMWKRTTGALPHMLEDTLAKIGAPTFDGDAG